MNQCFCCGTTTPLRKSCWRWGQVVWVRWHARPLHQAQLFVWFLCPPIRASSTVPSAEWQQVMGTTIPVLFRLSRAVFVSHVAVLHVHICVVFSCICGGVKLHCFLYGSQTQCLFMYIVSMDTASPFAATATHDPCHSSPLYILDAPPLPLPWDRWTDNLMFKRLRRWCVPLFFYEGSIVPVAFWPFGGTSPLLSLFLGITLKISGKLPPSVRIYHFSNHLLILGWQVSSQSDECCCIPWAICFRRLVLQQLFFFLLRPFEYEFNQIFIAFWVTLLIKIGTQRAIFFWSSISVGRFPIASFSGCGSCLLEWFRVPSDFCIKAACCGLRGNFAWTVNM